MLYRGMDRAQLDAAYNNTAAVPERDAIVADWAARSARVRRECAGHLDLAYGDTPRERLDLFLAAEPKAPTLAFIHGGYWQINDLVKESSPSCRGPFFSAASARCFSRCFSSAARPASVIARASAGHAPSVTLGRSHFATYPAPRRLFSFPS
jgi:acetyl esterase/lipase